MGSASFQPKWWTEKHGSQWENVKDAMKRDVGSMPEVGAGRVMKTNNAYTAAMPPQATNAPSPASLAILGGMEAPARGWFPGRRGC